MAETMFDGFDHTQYREEVEARWGEDAYARSDQWWRGLTDGDRDDWKARTAALIAEWSDAARDPSVTPDSPAAQGLAERHLNWLRSAPGITGDVEVMARSIADMYVSDARFARTYGGPENATFVRDAIHAYLDAH